MCQLRPCSQCGAPIPKHKGPGPAKKYCSRLCGRIATGGATGWDRSERACINCHKSFTPKTPKHFICSYECRLDVLNKNHIPKHTEEKPCVICGAGFVPRFSQHKTCSAKCSDILSKQKVSASRPVKVCKNCSKEFRPTGYESVAYGRVYNYCSVECSGKSKVRYLTSGLGVKPYSPVSFNNCKVCDLLFTAKSKSKILCSLKCREEKKEQDKAASRMASYERSKAAHVPKEITCKECGKFHITEYGDKIREFCSVKCSKRHNGRIGKATRKARIKGLKYERIDPLKVFARDKWVCRLCGIKTPKKLRGTIEDNAPELDHIIPVSKGGAHIYTNVQCACRKCNQSKSDKIIGQLPLLLTTAA